MLCECIGAHSCSQIDLLSCSHYSFMEMLTRRCVCRSGIKKLIHALLWISVTRPAVSGLAKVAFSIKVKRKRHNYITILTLECSSCSSSVTGKKATPASRPDKEPQARPGTCRPFLRAPSAPFQRSFSASSPRFKLVYI